MKSLIILNPKKKVLANLNSLNHNHFQILIFTIMMKKNTQVLHLNMIHCTNYLVKIPVIKKIKINLKKLIKTQTKIIKMILFNLVYMTEVKQNQIYYSKHLILYLINKKIMTIQIVTEPLITLIIFQHQIKNVM
jgi:hypothetical protein